MFPFAVAILPLFMLLRELDLLDNPLGVILPQAAFGLPVTIIILRSFFRTIPAEIEEAATLDGCSRFGFFWRILLPMARPALATVSVLAIVASWNNFFLPLVVFNDPSLWTLPLGVQNVPGPVLRRHRRASSPTSSCRWCPRWPSTPSPSGSSSAASPTGVTGMSRRRKFRYRLRARAHRRSRAVRCTAVG